MLRCYNVTMLQEPVERMARCQCLVQLLVYHAPHLVLVQRELLLVEALLAYLFTGQFLERAAVEVYFLHPVVHALAERRKAHREPQSADNELGLARHVELAIHQPCTDETITQQHEHILAVVLLMP